MQTILLNIWTAVRDFVNIMFVLGLMAIAVANIMGISSDKVALKTILPRIVIALIAVNFSFLACKVILDVVNVTSTAIFAIPIASDSLKKYTDPKGTAIAELSSKICEKMIKQESANKPDSPKGGTPTPSSAFCQDAKTSTPPADGAPAIKKELTALGKSFFSTFNSRNAALVMAIELQDIVNIDSVDTDKISDLKGLAINSIFSIIFFVIYATAFVALFVAMLIRVVVLWLTIAISPISFLGFAFPSVKGSLGENDPFKLFVSHALIPLKVSIVLTIGMIMISQLKNISGNSINATDPASLGAITTGISTVQDLIAGMATAAFIWIAAFEAFKGTKATSFVDKIRNKVGDFGKTVAKIPLYAPILPGPGGSKVGLAALGAGGGLTAGLQQKFTDENTRYAKLFGGKDVVYKDALKEAKGAKAGAAIGDLIVNTKVSVDKQSQANIAAKIKDTPELKGLKAPKIGGFATMEEFRTALEKGDSRITEDVMQDFYKQNETLLKAPSLDKKAISGPAGKISAAGKAKVTAGDTSGLGQAVTDLDAALKELDGAKTPDQIKTAREKVEAASKKVDGLTKAKDKITQAIDIKPTQINAADGTFKVKADADRYKLAYGEALQSTGGDVTETRKMLIEKIKKSAPTVDAEKVADSIINGTANAPAGANPPVVAAAPPVAAVGAPPVNPGAPPVKPPAGNPPNPPVAKP